LESSILLCKEISKVIYILLCKEKSILQACMVNMCMDSNGIFCSKYNCLDGKQDSISKDKNGICNNICI